MNRDRTKIFVLIGPSGVGKSTLINALQEDGIQFNNIISHTTRPVIQGEKEGADYFFISKADYQRKEQNNEFIISTLVHGNLYGILKKYVEEKHLRGSNLICSLNTEAANKLKKLFGKKVVNIFVAPQSLKDLEKRLSRRVTEWVPALKILLKNSEDELKLQDSFDYKIINNNIQWAVEELKKIVFLETGSQLIIKQFVMPASDKTIRAMSYNIRMFPCAEDEGTENAWVYRLPKIRMIFDQYCPDIIGVQELSSYQMSSLEKSSFRISYKFLGRYPTRKPVESGLGIIYNEQKLLLISDLHTIWLNELKNQPGGSAWDGSSYERYVIYAKFKNLLSGNNFWFMSTHFDHLGITARQESAKIVMALAEELDSPAVITGDFNCFPQLGGKELYQLLCTCSNKIVDSANVASLLFGVPGSWIGWDYDIYKQKEGYAKYDFIFVHNSIQVIQHGIIDDRVWDECFKRELYPSDHRPVLSDLFI